MNEETYRYKQVWDPLLRILHWYNAFWVLCQVILGTTLLVFGDDLKGAPKDLLEDAHALVGYALAAGILSRILWLFVGPPTARWRDFLPLAAEGRRVLVDTLKYYLSGFRRESPLYLGHNPLAGIVYLGFFILAAVQVTSGIIVLDTPEKQREGLWVVALHEAGYFLVLAYIMAHLPAVFLHEWGERHGLIGSMVHGYKTFTDDEWNKLTAGESKDTFRGGSDER